MKTLLFLVSCLLLLSCEKENKIIREGHYSGSFRYGNIELWESFGIEKGNFEEYASGGAISQKFPLICLTKGTYKISGGSIEFNDIHISQPPDKELSGCDQDLLLSGSYNIEEHTDSVISFWRNSNTGRQEYRLKLFYSK